MTSEKIRLVLLALMLIGLLLLSPVLAAQCKPSPTMSMGTHYKEITTHETDIGTGLLVSGRVLSAMDCTPIAGARINHWQADKKGKYVDHLRAFLFSDNGGRYRFETEWPGTPVPHIHFIVTAPGYEKLVTQWVGSEHVEQIMLDFVLLPAD
jgi:protocatechuate 3,4-dioxygenase beta subunit